ncbi:carbohydrate ABC transporter permease [Paenibacillus sp. JNUCC32]|jgi:putative aldouronate transport system permease protein|uniref:Carbohydrate ABC transporter permease n=1 Tax=Paenibacillus lautus TaxID=1401 RepID=A0A385TQR2_PAELA|nr:MULTISPECIES: carbohydrate ABC transporter permease [Paenibacillus]MBY0160997.1 carbohydrate ABC transporter permease [Cytobacillus firmus]VTR39167.1 Inner membrane ABC transporter permease protein ycjP [Actinobacillus pleuropneumoniae]AYB43455.1 carbohydrate ABC transporter permease [Paenibacillus lautus]MCI1773463.1 carbohydrate ABC transporter permease [Paenibacillus lautus]QOT11369.1 carbohydrate ABC transporter permease [Paenibacillus sp. JNUCC-32]
MKPKWNWFDALNALILTGVVGACLYPFVYMLAVSLSDSASIASGEVWLWPKGFNLDMYQYVFEDGRVLKGYKNTLIYVVLGTAISLLVTALGAYSLSKAKLVMGKPILMLIVFTMFFNGGMIPTFLVVKELGFVNTIWGMVLPGAVATWNLLIMRTFFMGMPQELEESGKIDGLSEIGIFFRIVLPLSKPVLATIGLYYAVGMWNNFMGPLLYLRDADMQPLQVILRNIVLSGQLTGTDGPVVGDIVVVEDGLKFATIMVSTLPILLVYPFIQKYFVKGALIGSVKG